MWSVCLHLPLIWLYDWTSMLFYLEQCQNIVQFLMSMKGVFFFANSTHFHPLLSETWMWPTYKCLLLLNIILLKTLVLKLISEQSAASIDHNRRFIIQHSISSSMASDMQCWVKKPPGPFPTLASFPDVPQVGMMIQLKLLKRYGKRWSHSCPSFAGRSQIGLGILSLPVSDCLLFWNKVKGKQCNILYSNCIFFYHLG